MAVMLTVLLLSTVIVIAIGYNLIERYTEPSGSFFIEVVVPFIVMMLIGSIAYIIEKYI